MIDGRSPQAASGPGADSPGEDRRFWLELLERLSRPVLANLSRRRLKRSMPVEEERPGMRSGYTHLEAFARLLAGIAPWLAASGMSGTEAELQRELRTLSQLSMEAAVDPASPDFMNFCRGDQPLVDSAFLAEAVLRGLSVLWDPFDQGMRRRVVSALVASRAIPTPQDSNWVLFAAMVETALLVMGQPTVEERLEGPLRRMLSWYKGDGAYGDGELFHFDYYNSFVIHPMLVDILTVLETFDARFASARATVLRRAGRHAAVLERLIAPDGTFPSVGRSAAYRFGAFHALAQMALLRALPDGISPPGVRSAMTAVMRRMTDAPGTFSAEGWLQIGFCGAQPHVGESYVSTGSLYLCSTALLPLGLAPADPFWSAPPQRWSSQKLWAGEPMEFDHALEDDEPKVEIPTLRR